MRQIITVSLIAAAICGAAFLAGCSSDNNGPTVLPFAGVSVVAYASTKDQAAGEIYTYHLTRKTAARVTDNALRDFMPAVSPDGKKLAYVEKGADNNENIRVVGLGSTGAPIAGTDVQVTNNSFINLTPAWSPDSLTLYYSQQADDVANSRPAGIYRVSAANPLTPEYVVGGGSTNPSVSPSEMPRLAFVMRTSATGAQDIYTLDLATAGASARQVTNFTDPTFAIQGIAWGPDAARLVFSGYSGAGNAKIYLIKPGSNLVVPAPLHGGAVNLGVDEGGPTWLSLGKVVYYTTAGLVGTRHRLYTMDTSGANAVLLYDDGGNMTRALPL